MRIIGKNHDYYDSVQKMGQDRSLVYLRNIKEDVVDEKVFPEPRLYHIVGSKLLIDVYIIGFCGKIYPVYELSVFNSGESVICFTIEEIDDFVKKNFKVKEYNDYLCKKKKYRLQHWNYWHRKEKFVEFFTEVKKVEDKFSEFFIKNNSPIFVVYPQENFLKRKIVYNDCLKDFEFYRKFDPYQAFQEISMFMGGLAQPQKEIPVVPDKIMLEIKGFDKFSFKKEKKKK